MLLICALYTEQIAEKRACYALKRYPFQRGGIDDWTGVELDEHRKGCLFGAGELMIDVTGGP